MFGTPSYLKPYSMGPVTLSFHFPPLEGPLVLSILMSQLPSLIALEMYYDLVQVSYKDQNPILNTAFDLVYNVSIMAILWARFVTLVEQQECSAALNLDERF